MIKYYSHSSTSTFRRCKFRFAELYCGEEGFTEEEEIPSPGARLGKAGHLALQAFYSGTPYKTAEEWAYQNFAPTGEDELKEFNRLRTTLSIYWAHTLTDRWKVKEVELEVKVGQYMGIFDLIVETANGQIFIVDHKFQKSKQTSHLSVTPQVSFYLMMAREMGLKVDGLLYNIIPTGTDPGKPVRKLCFRTENFLDNFKHELDVQIAEMKEFQLDPKPYRNFTPDCVWDCPIKDYCTHSMEAKWQTRSPLLLNLER